MISYVPVGTLAHINLIRVRVSLELGREHEGLYDRALFKAGEARHTTSF